MKILVISDSHESRFWSNFVQRFDFSRYDRVIHAGDNYSDIYDIEKVYKGEIIAVPGLWREEYQDPKIQNVRYMEDNAVNIIVSHVKKEGNALLNLDKKIIQIHGHTHAYELTATANGITFNPGHLKNSVDRGFIATYGEIIIANESVNFYIKDAISNKTILETKF